MVFHFNSRAHNALVQMFILTNNSSSSCCCCCSNRKSLFKSVDQVLCVFKHHESVADFTCADVFRLYTIPLIRCVRVRVFCVRWQENLPPNCGRGHTTQYYSTSWRNYFPSAMKIDGGKNARNLPAQWISKWLSFVIEFIKIDSVLMKMCGRMHWVRAWSSFAHVAPSICFVCSVSHSFFDFTLVGLRPFHQVPMRKVFHFKIHFEWFVHFYLVGVAQCTNQLAGNT